MGVAGVEGEEGGEMIDYDFDLDGQLIIDGQVIPHGDLSQMLEQYYDGICRICGCEIPDDGSRICIACLAEEQRAVMQ